MIELSDPETTNISDRNNLRWQEERRSFDLDHYLADYFLESMDELEDTPSLLYSGIHYEPYWHTIDCADGIHF